VSQLILILTSKIPADFALEGMKFTQQHKSFALETKQTKDFHDRFIIIDDSACYLLGASIKDAGSKGFTIVPLHDAPVVEFFLQYAEVFGLQPARYKIRDLPRAD
jgi:hypothetical protein